MGIITRKINLLQITIHQKIHRNNANPPLHLGYQKNGRLFVSYLISESELKSKFNMNLDYYI